MKVSELSKKDEKQRRSMSNLQLGDFVVNNLYGCYGWIRGFKTPWIWVFEPYTAEDNGARLVGELGEKTTNVHFTDLSQVSKTTLQHDYTDNINLAHQCQELAKIIGMELKD